MGKKNKNIADAGIENNNVGERRRNIGHSNKTESHSSDKSNHENNKKKIDKHIARSKKSEWLTKEFKFENSYLTEAFKNLDIRGVRHICYIVWIMWMVRLFILDYSSNKPFQVPGIATLLVSCHGIQHWLVSHFIFLISAVIVLVGFQVWYWTRTILSKPVRKIFDYICAAAMIVYMTALLVIPWWWILAISQQGVLAKEFVVGEQVRIYMKIVAFLSEKINEALRESDSLQKENTLKKGVGQSFFNLIYFLYAPTLLYRDEYPRNDKIRWSFALEHFIELFIIFYTGFVIYETEVEPSVSSYLVDQRPRSLLLLVLQNSLPFFALLVMSITAMWHSMQNAFAEILRFGDRRFYNDWWNEGTPTGFHRSNNLVVQDWLFFYVYHPVKRRTGSRTAAQLAVLLLSGVVHDIMLALALGFGFPLVLAHFLLLAIMLRFFKNERKKDALSNFSCLFFFPSGASCMGCILAVEHLARQQCQQVIESSWDYFYPRFLDCTPIN